MRKVEIAIIAILSLIIVASIATTLYAWFGFLEKTEIIIIHSGKVELEAHLYKKGSTEEITEELIHNYFVPGDVYEYDLLIKNEGTLSANLEIEFDFSDTSSHLKEFVTFTFEEDEVLMTSLVNNKYIYNDPLGVNKKQQKTVTFSFEISTDFTLEDLEEINQLVLKSITITLSQK